MDLIDRENTVVTLLPTRYEHPESLEGDGYDWVMVFGQITEQEGSWSFESAILLTSELEELSAWLHGVADGSVPTGPEWNEKYAHLIHTGSEPHRLSEGSQIFASGERIVYTEPGVQIEGPYPGIRFTEPGLDLSLIQRSANSVTLTIGFWKVNELPDEGIPQRRTESSDSALGISLKRAAWRP